MVKQQTKLYQKIRKCLYSSDFYRLRNPFEGKDVEKTEKLELTEEQQNAFDTICDSMDDMLFSEFLIFGVTGSRKN